MIEPIAAASLILAGICAAWIAVDIAVGHRQHMWIMNIVWPVTALYAGPLAVWAYYAAGRLSTEPAMRQAKKEGKAPTQNKKPFWQMAALAATHCGSGCTLADIAGEWGLLLCPFTLFGMRIFGAWLVDYVLALVFGIFFQYFSIAPMRHLGAGEGLKAAARVDFLSLTAWQVGMYGWMAVATFLIFRRELRQTDPLFWFMMQIGMLAGFMTAYPVNWWLLRAGAKEKM